MKTAMTIDAFFSVASPETIVRLICDIDDAPISRRPVMLREKAVKVLESNVGKEDAAEMLHAAK